MRKIKKRWAWLTQRMVVAAHSEQLTDHSGIDGVYGKDSLESILARPKQMVSESVGKPADAADLAASYAFGIAHKRPFVDGNTGTAFLAMEVFLNLNDLKLTASDLDCTLAMLELASKKASESDFAKWIRGYIEPV
jgi:death-on-curing protein